jgi:hypothetical protein
LSAESVLIPPSTLIGFCQLVQQKHGSEWPPTEETLADEFVEYFQLETLVNLEELQEICDRLGITFRIEQLPESLRGINYRYQEKREIVISDSQFLTKEHTTLHELREVIEYEFRDSGHRFAQMRTRRSGLTALPSQSACAPLERKYPD